MASNRLGSKTEEAAVIVAAAVTYAVTPNIYKGRDDASKTAPCVIFSASVAEEEPMGTGNFFVELTAKVKSIAENGESAHNVLASEIGDMMSDDGLAASLSAAAVTNFHCFAALEMSGSDPEAEGDCLVETITRRLYCCARDLS